MKNFKEFYYNLLSETPMFVGDSREDYSLDIIMAKEKYKDIKSNPEKYTLVRSNDDKISVDLYEEYDKNEVICWFVSKNNDFVLGYVAYDKLDDGGIETTSVYNDKQVKFLAFKVYMYYLVDEFKYIRSDKRHTNSGKVFWENIVSFSLGNGFSVFIIDASTGDILKNISNVGELSNYYGDEHSEKYRIKIEK